MSKGLKWLGGGLFFLGATLFLHAEIQSEIELEFASISDVTILMKAIASSTEQFVFNHVLTSSEITNNASSATTLVSFTITINDASGSPVGDGSINVIRIDSLFNDAGLMQMVEQRDPNNLITLAVSTNKNTLGVIVPTTLTQSSIVCNSMPGNRAINREYVITVKAAQGTLDATKTGIYWTTIEFSVTAG